MKKLIILLGLSTMFILSSCDNDDTLIEDFDQVSVKYDDDKDFSEITTFTIIDTVVQIMDTMHIVDNNLEISHKYDDHTLALVKENMIALGYEYVEATLEADPDVVMSVSVMAATHLAAYYGWDYYWGYPGYGYPWYPYVPYYPWGYPTSYYTAYDAGSIFIDMHDITQLDEEDGIPVVWASVIEGLYYNSSTKSTEDRISDGVNTAFSKSTFLGK